MGLNFPDPVGQAVWAAGTTRWEGGGTARRPPSRGADAHPQCEGGDGGGDRAGQTEEKMVVCLE